MPRDDHVCGQVRARIRSICARERIHSDIDSHMHSLERQRVIEMNTLRYSEDYLMRDHPYAEPQVVAGHRLHGGFDAAGRYLSPRTLVR